MEKNTDKPVYKKIEKIIGDMQNSDGIYFRTQKSFLTSIQSLFLTVDLQSWLEKKFIEDNSQNDEIQRLIVYFYKFGYIYQSEQDSRSENDALVNSNTLFRFQAPYFWLSNQSESKLSINYAIYLIKKQLKTLLLLSSSKKPTPSELKCIDQMRKNHCDKWEFILDQAKNQLRVSKEWHKLEKRIFNLQEENFWRIYNQPDAKENGFMQEFKRKSRYKIVGQSVNAAKTYKKKVDDSEIKNEDLENQKPIAKLMEYSSAIQSLDWFVDQKNEINVNIWHLEPDSNLMPLCPHKFQAMMPSTFLYTHQQLKLWSYSFDRLINDVFGNYLFKKFLESEYSGENYDFWMTTRNFEFGSISGVEKFAVRIYKRFLSKDCEVPINIDQLTLKNVEKELQKKSRFTFESAQEHIYNLMKRDSYARFLKSSIFLNLMKNPVPNDGNPFLISNNCEEKLLNQINCLKSIDIFSEIEKNSDNQMNIF